MDQIDHHFADATIRRDRDQFLRELLRELATVLEESVGLKESEGFISMVGSRIGEIMTREYQAASGLEKLSPSLVASALVDLKRRIDGGFRVESLDAEKMVLVNTACPFGHYVHGRRSLCMMTSNVFGKIAASNLGYARVVLEETIARGDAGCRVVVHFEEGEDGREYYG
ncbi:MAG: methanogen output domain 1-containing protein [Gammaproteobacteria bacterium]